MSSHRLTAPSQVLADRIRKATEILGIEQIRQALPEGLRDRLDGQVGVEMTHLGRAMTTGNRAALYGEVNVYPIGDDGRRSSTHVLVSWTFHGADDLVGRPQDLVLELDRITPVES
jgi:hypothetical protein